MLLDLQHSSRSLVTSPGSPLSCGGSRLDFASPVKAPGTTEAVAPVSAGSKQEDMGHGAKKDHSIRGLLQMHTGIGIECLYLPGGMLAELADGCGHFKVGAEETLQQEQGLSTPHQAFSIPPTTTLAVKDLGTSVGLSPDSEALLDWLLSPTNLPPSPCSPSCPGVVTGTAHCPSVESKLLEDCYYACDSSCTPAHSQVLATCTAAPSSQAKDLPSAKLQPCLTRLPVPSLMGVHSSSSSSSLGLASVRSAAGNGSKTTAVAHRTNMAPSPAHVNRSLQSPIVDTGHTLAPHILSARSPACLVRSAGRSSGSSSISSRPEWSSAYSCASALHPSPVRRSTPCFPGQPSSPFSRAGTHSPAATATMPRRLSSSAATPAVRSREAIRLPVGKSSSLAARVASTASTGPVSRAEADDHVAAARADELSSTAAAADPTHGSTTGRSRATASKCTTVQPAAKAAAKATAISIVAAEGNSAQPKRCGRQGSICTRPAAQPTAEVKFATRSDSVQLRRSARQSSILARSAVCPTAPLPALHATAPPPPAAAKATAKATAATAEADSHQLRRSAKQSSLRASVPADTSAKPGNGLATGPGSQSNPAAGRLHTTAKTGHPSKPTRSSTKSTSSAKTVGAIMTSAKVTAESERAQLRRSARQIINLARPAGKATARGNASSEHSTAEPRKASRQNTFSRVLSTTKTSQSKAAFSAVSSTAKPARARGASCNAAMPAAVAAPARTAARASRRAPAPKQAS